METTTSTTATTQVATISVKTEDIKALAQAAPVALAANQESVGKAIAFGQTLLLEFKEKGMSNELDAKMNSYLVNINATIKKMKERREPLTKTLNDIIRIFTGLENKIDRDTKDSIPAQIQNARNEFAKYIAEQNRIAEEKARIEKEKAIERVNWKAAVVSHCRSLFDKTLSGMLSMLQSTFNDMTLDSFEVNSLTIRDFSEKMFDFIADAKVSTDGFRLLNAEELAAATAEAKVGLYDQLSSEYTEAIKSKKATLIEQLPGKRSALEEAEQARIAALEAKRKADELAKAAKSEAEKKAAQEAQEAAQRAQEEEERLAKEEQERQEAAKAKALVEEKEREEKAKQEAAMKAAAQTAEATFDASVNATPTIEHTAQVRTGYIIEAKTPHAYLLIFQFWFEKEGSKLPMEKFEKKTLGSMKTFCEKEAIKTGTKIESPFIVYHDDYTVTAKK
jgi:hypothetical protein